jgi:hypothetical protein
VVRETNIGNSGKQHKNKGVKIKAQRQSYEVLWLVPMMFHFDTPVAHPLGNQRMTSGTSAMQ